ncbi:MAG: 1-deoxy-D-xylulose-5-phosphate reductoisomerase [Gammaproteobacteria bacterium]|nr:1-deoxy-D-xylulose-5-phosphate reductoisomerase [Gammaproteobacteria bacterium]
MQKNNLSKGIAILGSTGSVGISTLDVIERNSDKFHVVALGARRSVDELLQQVQKFSPSYVVLTDENAAKQFKQRSVQLDHIPELIVGSEGLISVAEMPEVDCVMAAIVGAAGLLSTLAAAKAGKTVLLANKEALVMSGELLIATAEKNNSMLLPIDSEHNAVFQCMQNLANTQVNDGVKQVTLTASGGPFLHKPLHELAQVSPEQACAHPKWKMGRKISVDSATMMNKGLEVIEACLLFSINISMVNVVIHPQSIVHAMVAYQDGSILAHMGFPDMRVPIAHAMAWPARIDSGVDGLDMTKHSGLEFFQPDMQRFPCLRLAMDVQKIGGSSPAIMNAANEVAVQSFLDGKIQYTQIYNVVASVIEKLEPVAIDNVETVLEIDRCSRQTATQTILELSR